MVVRSIAGFVSDRLVESFTISSEHREGKIIETSMYHETEYKQFPRPARPNLSGASIAKQGVARAQPPVDYYKYVRCTLGADGWPAWQPLKERRENWLARLFLVYSLRLGFR
jgi:hypothetical protein